jgi:large repetitive protein
MEATSKATKNIQRPWRITAFAIGSAFAMALATTASAAQPTPTPTPTPHTAPTSIATISPAAAWEGDTVTLDGTQSHTNPDGGTLQYTWQQQAPPVSTLVVALNPNNTTVTATLTAPAPQPLGTLSWPVTFALKVRDPLTTPASAQNTTSAPVTTTVYAAPGADAEPKDAHVNEGTTVHLTGNATTVQPGATLAYTWTAPNGIILSDVHAQNPTFTAPQVGTAGQALTFTLVVTEHLAGLSHDKDSAPDSVTINIDNVNQPPTALANTINDPNTIISMATVSENTVGVTLYGFGTDPDNDPLTFTWTQVHDTGGTPLGQPGDIAVILSDNHSTTPTFTAPNLTTQDHVDLVFQLITNDGFLNSGASYVTIRVNNTNNPPTAVPTATPGSAVEGDMVTLDGSGSTDPDGDTLTYSWAQAGTPVVRLVGSNLPQASFVAPAVSAQQGTITLTFNLTVDDGNGGTDTKPVSVTVGHNQPPTAIASGPGTVAEGNNACLDGSTSYDPEDGLNVTFAWVQVPTAGEPLVSLENPNTSGPCFDTPDVGSTGATLHFKLTVTDSKGASSSATVAVNVTYVNHPPTANPGNNQTVNEGATVHLSGSGTDPDGNPLTFLWEHLSGPAVNLSDPTDPNATFTAPQVFCAGDVVEMKLTVNDGFDGGTNSKTVNINIANVNNAPTASGGGNQQVQEGNLVSLHGTGNDADTEEVPTLAFQWTQTPQVGEPAVTLSPVSGKDVSFTAPSIGGGDPNASVDLHFHLVVSDGCGEPPGSATDDITVTVANIPHAPVAVATGPATANEGGSTVMLDGSGSYDPDFDPLTYVWTQVGGPAVTLVYSPGDTRHIMPSFVTPWVSTDTPVKFKLTVSDPYGGTSSAYVCVTINNWHTPPDVSGAHADVTPLWPPDHKMYQETIKGVVMQAPDTITITKVTQDEPTNGLGDGDTPIDAIITHNTGSDDTVLLREERSGKGDGRVYKICFSIADPEQNATGSVKVTVPHDKKTDTAIDSGQNYDSTH